MNVTDRNSNKSVSTLFKMNFMTHTMTTGCLIINNKFKLSALRSTHNVAYNRVYILQWFHLVMFWKASIRMYM